MKRFRGTVTLALVVLMAVLVAQEAVAILCWGSLYVANKRTQRNNNCPTPSLTKTWTIQCISGCGYITSFVDSLSGWGECYRKNYCRLGVVCLPLNGIDIRGYNPPSLSSTIVNRSGYYRSPPCLNPACYSSSINSIWMDCPCDSQSSPQWCAENDPLIVSVKDLRYQLTDRAGGVRFDLGGDGEAEQTAWTDARGDEAFLVLDRNGNGLVDSGIELFGDVTPQHKSAEPNGFLALAMFDDSLSGGNEDDRISADDWIYSSLQLWVDADHDGISDPDEMFWLADVGLEWISLDYKKTGRTDKFGNEFRFMGESGWADRNTRKVWNVFLVAD